MPNGYVSQIQINGGDVQNIGSCAYAVCDTLEDVVEKVVTFPNFVLKTGATIHVKFTYRNTALNPKLNVNGTGAKSIVMNTNNDFDSSLNLDSQYNVEQTWMAGAVVTLTYADSCWIVNNPSRITTPYTYNISTGGTLAVDSYIVLADLEWEVCTGSSNVTARVFPFKVCMCTMVDGIYRDRSALMEVFVGGAYNNKDFVDIMIHDESECHSNDSYVFRSLVDSLFIYFEYEVTSGNVIGKRTGHLLGKIPSQWSLFQLVPLTSMSVAPADPDSTHHFLKFDIARSASSFEPSASSETSIPSDNTLPVSVGVHRYLIKARLRPFDIEQLSGDGSTAGQYLKSNGSTSAPSWESFDTTPTENSTRPVTSDGIRTALDAKQPTISVTTNTTDPTDNDTVIMQASGTTNTTTFLRRKLSYLWNWIKSKADAIYWRADKVEINIPNSLNRLKKILSTHTNDTFYALNERYPVTWKTYTTETDEFYEDNSSRIPNLFNGHLEDVYGHPLTGEYDIIEMDFTGASGGYFPPSYTTSSGAEGYLTLHFRGSIPEQTPKVEYCVPNSTTWVEVSGESINDNQFKIFAYKINARLAKLRITVIGKTGGESNPSYRGASIANIFFMSGRGRGVEQYDIVTKYKFKQDLYGEVIAPKFTVRGGTNKQVLLANGNIATLPLLVSNGGTGATDWKGAEYNINQRLRATEISASINDNTLIPFLRDSDRDVTNGLFAGYRKTSTLWTYIKSKADLIYSTITETNKKTNRIIDHTWNQPSYSASASGTHVKICDIPTDCVCVMNVRKSVYGYPSINTLWIGNNNSLDFKSLTETDIVATVSSRICTLSVPAHTSSGTPLHTYDFEISVLNKDDLSSITWYDDATYYSPSRPTKPNIVMQQSAPVTDGSLAFNVNSSTHVASVSVDGYTDFVGMLTEDSDSAVLVKLSDEEEGSVYRFTFDHAIEGGVSFSNSNASTVYCEVSQDIHAGDTITLTAVSNTADGWIASVSSAGIISSDNSVNIEWENGVADLSVEKVPFNNIVNKAMFEEGDSPYPLAVGEGSEAIVYTGDSEYPYAYSETCSFAPFTVDGGESVFYLNNATSGTTYTIVANYTTQSFTAEGGGKIAVIKVNNNSIANELTTSVPWIIGTQKIAINQIQRIRTSYYFIIRFTYSTAIYENSFIACFIKKYKNTFYINTALGNNAKATGSSATALGNNAQATGSSATALGYIAKATGSSATALGNNAQATGSSATALGNNAKATGSSATALGNNAQATGSYATALGNNAQATGSSATALGNYAKATGSSATALGYNSVTALERAIAVGDNAYAGYNSNDDDYPKYLVKRFTAIDFKENGVTKKVRWVGSNDEVTIVLNGITVTLSAPNNNSKFFIIVNDSLAVRIGKPLTSYAKINGVETYFNIGGYNVTPVAVNGNSYYALWMYSTQSYFQNTIDSFSFLAYYKATYSQGYMFAFGYNAVATNTHAIAFGNETRAIRDRQIVIGSGNIPDENALFIIGGGSYSANSRKNILTIDDKEIVHARAYISDPQTYDTEGNSVSLGTITMGILKVTGGGAITFTNQNAVEGHCVKVYASGNDITCNGDTITAGKWKEYMFLDGAWHSQM